LELNETGILWWLDLPTLFSDFQSLLRMDRQELTPCLVQSSVTLSVPMDAPVTFSTELVSVSWSLRFEFVISPPESRWS
ncbi:unnamed protein product, partial [Ectocarpus sp. 13 AM-2016]